MALKWAAPFYINIGIIIVLVSITVRNVSYADYIYSFVYSWLTNLFPFCFFVLSEITIVKNKQRNKKRRRVRVDKL